MFVGRAIVEDDAMQVITAHQSGTDRVVRRSVIAAVVVGGLLLLSATALAWLIFGTSFLSAFTPSGRASTTQLVIGAVAWTFGLVAPAAFGFLGIARLGRAFEGIGHLRRRPSPVLRARQHLADELCVAVRVRLPDGSRVIPELVIGPFGAAIVEELPPEGAVVARGPRSWDVRLADGKVHMIDHPLERATRDAERVRTWFGGDDADHIVKVYAAVVGTDPNVARTPTCAYITPAQVGPWLASLPAQRSFDADRRERIVRMVEATL